MKQKDTDMQYTWERWEMNQIWSPMILGSRFSSTTEGCVTWGGCFFYGSICRIDRFGLLLEGLVTVLSFWQPVNTKTFPITFGHNIEDICFTVWQGPEAGSSWVRGDNWWQSFVRASCKTDWNANKEAVVIQSAVPYTTDFCSGQIKHV